MTKHRKVGLSCILLLVIALVTVTPTLAWLSARSDSVVNYFGGGAIAITLDETSVDADGNPIEGESRVTENHYKYTAGSVLTKDPTVTVLANSEDCYVYVCVDNQLPVELFTLDFNLEDWVYVAEVNDMTIYRYAEIVECSEENQVLTPIFTEVIVSSELTTTHINELGTRTVTVTAFAIQALALETDKADELAQAYFFDGVEIALEDDGIQYTVSTAVEDTSTEAEVEAEEDASATETITVTESAAAAGSAGSATTSGGNETVTSGTMDMSTSTSMSDTTEATAETDLTAEDEATITEETPAETADESDQLSAIDEATEVAEELAEGEADYE